jgi:hypothetical protein
MQNQNGYEFPSAKVKVVGYEENRTVSRVGNDLIPSKNIRRYLRIEFPNGDVRKVRTSRAVIDKFIDAVGMGTPPNS